MQAVDASVAVAPATGALVKTKDSLFDGLDPLITSFVAS